MNLFCTYDVFLKKTKKHVKHMDPELYLTYYVLSLFKGLIRHI